MKVIKNFVERHPDLFRPMAATQVLTHDRILERTVLKLFPRSVTPNQVTMFRIFATPLVFWLTLSDHLVIGILAFLLVAFTDMIDGSMARTRDQVTNFGKLFDPMADKFLIGSMVLIIVFNNFPPLLGLTILGLEILFIIIAFVSKVKFKTVRMANGWGKLKMFLQVAAVFLTLVALLLNHPNLLAYAAWVFGLAIGAALMSLFAQGI